jgi:hypothetical protein
MIGSCLKAVLSLGEVLLLLLGFKDLLGLLEVGESSSIGSGQLFSQELGSFSWGFVEITSQGGSFLLVQDGQVSSDILSDGLDFGEFSTTAGWGLGVSEGS